MKGKLLFVAGIATGYVIGSRAGRSAYTQLMERVKAIRESDPVQHAVGSVQQAVQQKAPGVTAAVSAVAGTASSVADAAASAPAPEEQEVSTASSTDADAEQPKPKRTGRQRSSANGASGGSSGAAEQGTPGETAEEAARVFEEQLPETAPEGASSIAGDGGSDTTTTD